MERHQQKTEEYIDSRQYLAKLGKEKLAHYQKYYRYELPEGKQPGEIVNSLFEKVMRNDKEALEQVLGILADSTFAMLCSRLESAGCYSEDNLDDLMQIIRMEIMQMSFRGFPQKVTTEGFYGYLIRIVQNQALRYRNSQRNDRYALVYEDNAKKKDKQAPSEKLVRKQGLVSSPMEEQVICQEEEMLRQRVIDYFIAELAGTDKKPYQVITYGYACLLPKIINDSRRRELRRKVNDISGRESGKQSSGYEDDTDSLWGDIARKNGILMSWAMDAMCRKTVQFLAEEFAELYNMDPLNGKAFSWKKPFQKNLKEEEKGTAVAELIITEEFDQVGIKNWPPRMEKALIDKTRERIWADRDFMEKSSQCLCH